MGKAYWKDVIREISNSKARFLSIFAIVLIGVAFFAGLTASGPVMKETGNQYFDDTQLIDVKVQSLLGITDEDYQVFEDYSQENDAIIEGKYTSDVKLEDSDLNTKMIGIHPDKELNQFRVVEGRMPEESGEIALDSKDDYRESYEIGDTLEISEVIGEAAEISEDGKDTEENFNQSEFTIVGFVQSPEYIENIQRGGSPIGAAVLDGFAAIMEEDLDLPYFTEVQFRFNQTAQMDIFSDEYSDFIDQRSEELEALADDRAQVRYEEIQDEGQQEIDEGQEEIDEGRKELQEAEEELTQAEEEIESGQEEINQGQETLNQKREDVNQELIQGQQEVDQGFEELQSGQERINQGQSQIDLGFQKLQQKKDQANLGEAREEVNRQYDSLQAIYQGLNNKLNDLQTRSKQLEDQREQASQGFNQAETELNQGQEKVEEGIQAVDQGIVAINERIESLDGQIDQKREKITYLKTLPDQINQLKDQRSTLQEELENLENKRDQDRVFVDEEDGEEESEENREETAEDANDVNDQDDNQLLAELQEIAGQIASIDQEIQSSETQLSQFKEEFEKETSEVQNIRQDLVDQKQDLESKKEELSSQLNQVQTRRDQLEETKSKSQIQLDAGSQMISAGQRALLLGMDKVTSGQEVLSAAISEIDAGFQAFEQAEGELNEKQAQLENAKNVLEASRRELEAGQEEIEAGRAAAEEEFQKAQGEIDEKQAELDEGIEEYEEGRQTFEEERTQALEEIEAGEEELEEAKQELEDMEEPPYFVQVHEDMPGLVEYGDNANRIAAIATIFPVFFFFLAILISLTTMTRMVDEGRQEIGTMKALGYSNRAIATKYLAYAFVATVVGTVFGLALGLWLFPTVIAEAYSALYNMSSANTRFFLGISILSAIVALASTGVSTFIATRNLLKSNAATLLRPKAPKVGQRILIEKIPFIWNNLSFTQKVSSRNLFRYKRRMFMTVFGVAGGVALLLTGFGLSDSISKISEFQYDDLTDYDVQVLFNEEAEDQSLNAMNDTLDQSDFVDDYLSTYQEKLTAPHDETNQEVTLLVPEDQEKMSDYFLLRDADDEELIHDLDGDGAVITQKLADLFEISEGDTLTLENSDNESFEVDVDAIVENYVEHFVYMSGDAYQEAFDEELAMNTQVVQNDNSQADEEKRIELEKQLSDEEAVRAIVFQDDVIESSDAALDSLNIVTIVLIVSAGSLAFVVLYNLTNINVSERIRELSTIKVLGFYDMEVTLYVYRENMVLTIMGILVGFVLGIIMHRFVITTAELDALMFVRTIDFTSYLYSALLMLLFSTIVMIVMHFRLKNVDMVEALKTKD